MASEIFGSVGGDDADGFSLDQEMVVTNGGFDGEVLFSGDAE